MPGREQQSAGTTNESAAVSPTAGFIGWTPETDRTVYKVTSASKKGAAEVADTTTRTKQFYR